MDHTKFQENMLLYGADISRWPELLQKAAHNAVERNAALQQMLVEERAFEKEISQRPLLENDPGFGERIIAIAASRGTQPSWWARLRLTLDEITELLPFSNPAYALAGIAIAGFVLGMLSQPDTAAASTSSLPFLYEVRGIV